MIAPQRFLYTIPSECQVFTLEGPTPYLVNFKNSWLKKRSLKMPRLFQFQRVLNGPIFSFFFSKCFASCLKCTAQWSSYWMGVFIGYLLPHEEHWFPSPICGHLLRWPIHIWKVNLLAIQDRFFELLLAAAYQIASAVPTHQNKQLKTLIKMLEGTPMNKKRIWLWALVKLYLDCDIV